MSMKQGVASWALGIGPAGGAHDRGARTATAGVLVRKRSVKPRIVPPCDSGAEHFLARTSRTAVSKLTGPRPREADPVQSASAGHHLSGLVGTPRIRPATSLRPRPGSPSVGGRRGSGTADW